MRKGNSLLILILGIIVLSGLACLEVNDKNTNTNVSPDQTTSTTPTDTIIDDITLSPSPTVVTEASPTPSSTPVSTISPEPTPVPTKSRCEMDMETIQAAIDIYITQHNEWPTVDGQPGPMDWDKLIPGYMDEKPYANDKCKWGVNSDPQGDACMAHRC